jgi:exonuclease SbcC
MIPIKLAFKGLYSYQGEQTIHFGPLMEGQLFGIFGSVGSGKSSILDAITYALYGETERLNQRDNRNYNMMNLQSNVMEIDFEFENFDQKIFRFVVLAKRHGSRFDEVQSPKRSAYQWDDHQWVPLETNTAESIIGLSYQNFKRTIIIPQGRFQEFLQLGISDRTKMMKEIFNLDKYELSGKVSYLERNNHEKKIRLETRLTQFQNISEKWITEKSAYNASLEKQLTEKKEKHKIEEDKLANLNQSKKRSEELALTQDTLKKLEEQSINIQQKKKGVDQYEYALQHFKKMIDADQDASLAMEKNHLETESLKQSISSLQLDIKSLEHKKAGLLVHIDNKDKYQDQAEDLGKWNEIISAEHQMQTQQIRIDQGKLEVTKVLEQLSLLDNEESVLKTQLTGLKKDIPNLETITQLERWFQNFQSLEKQINQIENELLTLLKQEQAAKMELDGVFPEKVHLPDSLQNRKDKKDDVVGFFHQWKHALQSEMELQTSKLHHLKMQTQLSKWTDQIKEGAPCPLCGATHHPMVLQVENVEAELTSTNHKIQQYQVDIHQVDHGLQSAISIQQRVVHLSEQIKRLKEKKKTEMALLNQHKTKFQWEQLLTPQMDQWESFRRQINQKQDAIQSIEKRLITIQNDVKTQERNLEKYKLALQKIQHNQISLKSSIDTLSTGVKELKDRNQLDLEKSLTDQSRQLITLIQEYDKQYDQITTKLQQAQQAFAGSNAELGKNEKQLKELATTRNRNRDALNHRMIDSPFETIEQIIDVLNLKIDLSKTREEIQRFNNELAILQNRIKKINEELTEKPYNHKLFKVLSETVTQLASDLEKTHTSLIKEQAEYEREKENLREKKSLDKELQQVESRGNDILVLKKLFKGSGFVNYISSVFLKNLCLAANARFYQLTRQQYKLEITEKNEFVVRDFLNDGKIRSVKTLSGGQTFQASLSLALALAESVQQQNKANQNFFFLDEGFGALDKNALEIVFDTLKSLRKENRIVGVISHVDDLQQEIDVFIQVTNDPENGSSLNPSWEN